MLLKRMLCVKNRMHNDKNVGLYIKFLSVFLSDFENECNAQIFTGLMPLYLNQTKHTKSSNYKPYLIDKLPI